MKKQNILLIFAAFSLVIFMALTLAANECSLTTKTSCLNSNSTVVMGLTGLINAHGELASEGNYDTVLCCNFPGSLTCNGNNKILGLTTPTNGEAEAPERDYFQTDVCYADLRCVSRTNTCETGELEILSLTSETDAHIGAYNDYNTKICCSFPSGEGGSSDTVTNDVTDGSTDNSHETNNKGVIQINDLSQNLENIPFYDINYTLTAGPENTQIQNLNSNSQTSKSQNSSGILFPSLFILLLIILLIVLLTASRKK